MRLDDAMNYDEPWGWMQPARHALGALLLETENVAEAEQVYRADLKRHPRNPWALHGLAECLTAEGKHCEGSRDQEPIGESDGTSGCSVSIVPAFAGCNPNKFCKMPRTE